MKRTILIISALFGIFVRSVSFSQEPCRSIPGVSVAEPVMSRDGRYLTVGMKIGLSGLHVGSDRAVLLTPRLVNGSDSMDLPSIGVYGRTRYYYYLRNGSGSISGESETSYRASEMPGNVEYNTPILYKGWMDGATLRLHRSDWGCCHEVFGEYDVRLGRHSESFFPELVFVRPRGELEKSRSLSGSAYIDFPVNQTAIYPDYHNNAAELGRIEGTIDSVRTDRDVTITSVWLKGYASPESPYSHNTDLAVGRTAALKAYIGQLFHFADGVIRTAYEPENWEGLRQYVDKSDMAHRSEILAMIDSDMEPDAKEAAIKRAYPKEYRYLLQHCYPYLRRTDYRIDYNIRAFNDVEEIKRVMSECPQKLGMNEFYLVSQCYEPGTEEFTRVFETAVLMFPFDEVANLNAANAAIRRDDFASARRYLSRSGVSAEAFYARGALAVREKDYVRAVSCFQEAASKGLSKANEILSELKERGNID